MKKVFLLIFLTSCSSSNMVDKFKNNDFDLNQDLSFIQYKELVIQYAKASPFPDLNK